MDVQATYSKCLSGLATVALLCGFSSSVIADTATSTPIVGTPETSAQVASNAAAPKLGTEIDSRIVMKADVVGVDKVNRSIRLKMQTGELVNIPGNADVPDFDNIAVGDIATVEMYQSLVVYKGTQGESPKMDQAEALTHHSKEGKPGSALSRTVDLSVQVKEINQETREVSVIMPNGYVTTAIASPSDAGFDGLKVGDTIHVRLVQGFTIDVAAAS